MHIILLQIQSKTFILKTSTNGREVCSSMKCAYCGKPVKTFEDFILVGKYPTRGQMWRWSEASSYVAPENYGKIYHKDCFMASLKKEKAEP
jgi:alpha-L-arabinofuranosidase